MTNLKELLQNGVIKEFRTFNGADISNQAMSARGLVLIDQKITDCKFGGQMWGYAYDCAFENCSFIEMNTSLGLYADTDMVFKDCTFKDCTFDGSNLKGVVFRNCGFENCSFKGANTERTKFRNCTHPANMLE